MNNCKDCIKQDVCNRDVGHGYSVCLHYLSADVAEVKHGEWKGKPIAGYSNIRCSVCNAVFLSQTGKWHYCPNCGAKMDGKGGAE